MNIKEKKEWNEHWSAVNKSFFGWLLEAFRKYVLAYAVRHYHERYFDKKGTFLEAGSGTAQTSIRLKQHERTYVAIDISKKALKEARKIKTIHDFIEADIRKLPYDEGTVSGIWNLGVMEHFSQKEIKKILKEFKRVLRKNGVLILFWPYKFAPYELMLRFLVWLNKFLFRKKVRFFPDEPSLLKSKKQAREIMAEAGFLACKVHFNIRDLFSYMVLVCRK